MDGIVDAAVSRHKTAEHLAVGGVDDGVGLKQRDVATPDGNAISVGERAGIGCAAALNKPLLQVGILDIEHLCRERFGRPHVHEGPEQIVLLAGSGGNSNAASVRSLVEQCIDKPNTTLGLIHG